MSSEFPKNFSRVMLKLSGETLGGGELGINTDVVENIALQITNSLKTKDIQLCLVVGGGNFFRGKQLSNKGMDRARADYMGMLFTVINSLALQDFLERKGVTARVQTAITMGQVAEPYIPLKAIRHMEKGRVVIFAAGIGLPYFSTDTVAAQRALEMHCDAIFMAKNGVDGVYSSDPKKDKNAKKYSDITYAQAIEKGLNVIDSAAFSLCKDNKLPMVVFGIEGKNNIYNALTTANEGTLVHN